MKEQAKIRSKWLIECFDRVTGKLKWATKGENLVTDQGQEYLLDAGFLGGTQRSSWYMTLFENSRTPESGDTYQTPGYTEFTAYTQGVRPSYTGVRTDQTISNTASRAEFTADATKTLYGGGLVAGPNAATKGNTAAGNILYCSVLFDESYPVEAGDPIRVTVNLGASG